MTLDGGAEHMARFASSAHAVRSFCERCGSSLFAESTHRADQIDVVLAAMEGPIDHAPQAHVFYDSGAEWVRIGDDLPTLGGPTGVEPIARAR